VAKITEVQPGSAEAAKIEEAVEAMEVDVEGEES
jgi:hypothetical protein